MLSRMRNSLLAAATVLAAIMFLAAPVSAQSMAATLSGTVKDPADASIPGAKITLTNRATHESRTLMTNETGLFVAPDVDAGTYDLSVEKQGFKLLSKTDISVTPQGRLSLG